jgi:hypothetical protein
MFHVTVTFNDNVKQRHQYLPGSELVFLPAMLRIRICIILWSWIQFRIKVKKQDPDSHQSEKVEALECHFGALEGPNLGKIEW